MAHEISKILVPSKFPSDVKIHLKLMMERVCLQKRDEQNLD